MKAARIAIAPLCLLLALHAHAVDSLSAPSGKTLFVYDKIEKSSKLFVHAFRENLREAGLPVDECAVDSSKVRDLSPYQSIVIYSRVMAFNMMSSVRRWVRSTKSLENKKVFLFVTANRLAADKHRKGLAKLVEERHGTVVDAVSMATKDMSEAQKAESVRLFVAKVKQ